MPLPDPDAVTQIIRAVATEEIMPRWRNLGEGQIREKTSPRDLVTDADEAAERVLKLRLSDLLPGSVVVGEEAAHADPGVLDHLAGADPVWVLDPVDGTNNFSKGYETFGVIVALVHRGETVMGWIHHPVDDSTAVAERGAGAWLDGSPLAVPKGTPLRRMAGSVANRQGKALKGRVARTLRQGAVAADYTDLACGRLHFAAYKRLKPWDHAAGLLLHAEAGGVNRLMVADRAYRPVPPFPEPDEILCAPDEATWMELRDILTD